MPNQSDIDLANIERQYAAQELASIVLDTETPVVPRRTVAEWEALRITTPPSAPTAWDPANLHPYGYSDPSYTMRMFGDTPIFETQRWENVYQIEDNMYTIQETMEVAGVQIVKLLNINTNETVVSLLSNVSSSPIGRIRL